MSIPRVRVLAAQNVAGAVQLSSSLEAAHELLWCPTLSSTKASVLQAKFKYVDDLATVWCEWAEMELRHKNFKRALDLMRRATVPPARAGPRRSQEEMQGPVQGRLYRRCAGGLRVVVIARRLAASSLPAMRHP